MKVWKKGNNIVVDMEDGGSNKQITIDDYKVDDWKGSDDVCVFDERIGRTYKDSFDNIKDESGASYGATQTEVYNNLSDLSINNTGESGPGVERAPEVVTVTTDGATKAGVQNVGLIFFGDGGTMDGEEMGNGEGYVWNPVKGKDTVGSISYTVPVGGRVRIHYLNS